MYGDVIKNGRSNPTLLASVAGLQWSRSQYCARQPVYVTVTARDRVTNCKQLKQLKQLETD